MPHRAVAIANEFLRMPGAAEIVTQMQVQKLVYISHGWNLALNDAPLVSEPVEAWAYGPVYRDLYDHTKFFGKEPIGREITEDDRSSVAVFLMRNDMRRPPYRAHLMPREAEVLRHVWNRYGDLNGVELSRLTHRSGTPWFQTFTKDGRDGIIPEKLIKEHYQQLARAAAAN